MSSSFAVSEGDGMALAKAEEFSASVVHQLGRGCVEQWWNQVVVETSWWTYG
jgi:hypothetical protein